MHQKACLFAALLAAGCTAGAPAGFSKGDHWTFPLVGPLEDGLLITPVTVRGHGPYLFALDPDANVTSIDKQVAEEADLTASSGPTRVDEAGEEQTRSYAELVDLQVGTLSIDHRQVMVVTKDFYNAEGRRVHGVLGRDVLSDALVFGFDRDQGIAMLSMTKTFAPPPDAIAIKYASVLVDPVVSARGGRAAASTSTVEEASRVGVATRGATSTLDVTPLPRRVATAQIGDAKVSLHLDPGSAVSQLREPMWSRAKLAPTDVKERLVDEVGTVRDAARAGVAAGVTLGAAQASHVTFVPYVDQRFPAQKLDGALGLDFFRPYAVFASWDASTFYLKPRGDAAATATARLGRWGTALPACPHPGCVTATLTKTDGGIRLDVARDPQAAKRDLEVLIGVTPAQGKSAAPLTIELPRNVDSLTGGVAAEYEGATLTILDASPFARPCGGDGGCLYNFATRGTHGAP